MLDHLPFKVQDSTIGFYFHIPFCPHICPYCDFVKTAKFSRHDVTNYFQLLEKQLDFFLNTVNFDEHKTATVYFGGGTPGLFPAVVYAPLLEKIQKRFILEEVTLETNPLNHHPKRMREYLEIGFDRMTVGAQSLCPNTLKILGRKHTPEMVLNQLEAITLAGFKNIQVDFIYGLKPGIKTVPLKEQLQQLFHLGVGGISAYALSLEERTLFGKTDFAHDDTAADDYAEIYDSCINEGLKQVETSNFSKTATYHNNLYWLGYPYIGLGTGAHGLLPPTEKTPFGQRYHIGEVTRSHAPGNDLLDFHSSDEGHSLFKIMYEEGRTQKHFIEEMVFLLLRTPWGIPLSFLKKYDSDQTGRPFEERLCQNKIIQRGLEDKLLILDKEFLKVASHEKIRGDRWALEIIYSLQ